jgi:hypothetical protein
MILFDTMASGTPDPDFEVNFGNISVLPENIADADGDGDVDIPDVSDAGSLQVYTFDDDRIVFEFVIVDLDSGSGHEVRAFDAGDNLLFAEPMMNGGDASLQTIVVDTAGVRRLEIEYNDSAGVRGLDLDCGSAMPAPPPSTPPSDDPQASVADVDCDGKVAPTDALTIMKFAAGFIDAPDECQAQATSAGDRSFGDLNCDGAVDVYDAFAILRWVAGMDLPAAVRDCLDI